MSTLILKNDMLKILKMKSKVFKLLSAAKFTFIIKI